MLVLAGKPGDAVGALEQVLECYERKQNLVIAEPSLGALSRDPFTAEEGRDAHSDSIRRPDLERHPGRGCTP